MGKIAIIFTGGTISMRQDSRGAVVPKLDGEDIVKLVPELQSLAQVEAIDFGKRPGPHMGPEEMWQLRQLVLDIFSSADIDGIVITHGTDTLEETAYLLDLTIDEKKPIVLVGAMKNSSEEGWDGPDNLVAAVATAISPTSWQKGVLVVMNGKIYAASEVTKVDTQSVEAFDSPEKGPIGVVVQGKIKFLRRVSTRKYIPTSALELKVDLIKVVSGMDDRFVRCSLQAGVKGLVVEAMGCGNVPPGIVSALEECVNQGIKVMVVSRSPQGAVAPIYGYLGGGRYLADKGLFFGENLPSQKARIKLMAALGKTHTNEELKKLLK